MNLLSILFPQTVYKTDSQFSGEIKVIDHVFERRLVVGGLTQSGGITRAMWRKALSFYSHSGERSDTRISRGFWTPARHRFAKAIAGGSQNDKQKVRNVLVLGLGAGTVGEVINKKWPSAKIIGVEIDPVIIEIGKKYFKLSEIKNLEIVNKNAIVFVNYTLYAKRYTLFDVVIVDLYKGYAIEKRIEDETFLQKIARKLAKNGIVIFNVLPRQNDNFEAKIFLDKLSIIFQDNFCKRIIINDFFFCTKPRKGGVNHSPKGGELSMAKKKKRKKR